MGVSASPVRYMLPDIACATPSKPTRSAYGPGPPNAVAVVRMMSGLIATSDA